MYARWTKLSTSPLYSALPPHTQIITGQIQEWVEAGADQEGIDHNRMEMVRVCSVRSPSLSSSGAEMMGGKKRKTTAHSLTFPSLAFCPSAAQIDDRWHIR